MYTTWKVDGDRHSQVRWRKVRGHDKSRRMGVAIAIYFPAGISTNIGGFLSKLIFEEIRFHHTNERSPEYNVWYTLQGSNISFTKALLKMIFLSPRWDNMLVPRRVCDSLKRMIFYQVMWGSITRWFHQPSNVVYKIFFPQHPCMVYITHIYHQKSTTKMYVGRIHGSNGILWVRFYPQVFCWICPCGTSVRHPKELAPLHRSPNWHSETRLLLPLTTEKPKRKDEKKLVKA